MSAIRHPQASGQGPFMVPNEGRPGLILSLGPCRVRLASSAGPQDHRLPDHWRGFVRADHDGWDFLVNLQAASFSCSDPPTGYTRKPSPHGFVIESGVFRAEVDLTQRVACIRGSAFPAALQVLLRNLLPWLVSPGLVLHAALLRLEEALVACCGPSGAGKSTLARLAGHRALCDELALASPTKHGTARAFALPFWRARPGEGSLRAIVLLAHAAEHRLTPVPPSQAARALAAHVLWPTYSRPAMLKGFRSLAELVQQVPVLEFGFRPESSASDYLVKALPPERKKGNRECTGWFKENRP